MPIGPQPSVHRAVYPFHANLMESPSAEGMKKRQPHSCNCLIFIGGNKRI